MLIEYLLAISFLSLIAGWLASALTDYHPKTHFLRVVSAIAFFITGAAIFLYPVDFYSWVLLAAMIAVGIMQLAIYNKLKAHTGGQPWTPEPEVRHGGISTDEMLKDYPFHEDD